MKSMFFLVILSGLSSVIYLQTAFAILYWVVLLHNYMNFNFMLIPANMINKMNKFFDVFVLTSFLLLYFLSFETFFAIVSCCAVFLTSALLSAFFQGGIKSNKIIINADKTKNIYDFFCKTLSEVLNIDNFFEFTVFFMLLVLGFLSLILYSPANLQSLLCGAAVIILSLMLVNFLIDKAFKILFNVFDIRQVGSAADNINNIKTYFKYALCIVFSCALLIAEISFLPVSDMILPWVLKLRFDFLPVVSSFNAFGIFLFFLVLIMCCSFLCGKYLMYNTKPNCNIVGSLKPIDLVDLGKFLTEESLNFAKFNLVFISCFMVSLIGFNILGIVWYKNFILSILLSNNVSLYYQRRLKLMRAVLILNTLHLVMSVLGVGIVNILMYSFACISLYCGVSVCAASIKLNLISLLFAPASLLQILAAESLKFLANFSIVVLKIILDVIKLVCFIVVSAGTLLYNLFVFIFGLLYSFGCLLVELSTFAQAWQNVQDWFSLDCYSYVINASIYNNYPDLDVDCERFVNGLFYEKLNSVGVDVCEHAESIFKENLKVVAKSNAC